MGISDYGVGIAGAIEAMGGALGKETAEERVMANIKANLAAMGTPEYKALQREKEEEKTASRKYNEGEIGNEWLEDITSMPKFKNSEGLLTPAMQDFSSYFKKLNYLGKEREYKKVIKGNFSGFTVVDLKNPEESQAAKAGSMVYAGFNTADGRQYWTHNPDGIGNNVNRVVREVTFAMSEVQRNHPNLSSKEVYGEVFNNLPAIDQSLLSTLNSSFTEAIGITVEHFSRTKIMPHAAILNRQIAKLQGSNTAGNKVRLAALIKQRASLNAFDEVEYAAVLRKIMQPDIVRFGIIDPKDQANFMKTKLETDNKMRRRFLKELRILVGNRKASGGSNSSLPPVSVLSPGALKVEEDHLGVGG